jgi:hypothetical protein
MCKKIILCVVMAMLLTCGAYAAEPQDAGPDEDTAVITVTDVTPQAGTGDPGVDLPDVLPLSVETLTEGGVELLVKTYEVAPDATHESLVEEKPERAGVAYTLREITKQELPPATASKSVSQAVAVTAPSDKQEDILPLLEKALSYNADGYTGDLFLDENSISAEVESTKGYTYTAKEVRQYTGLNRNDPYLLPKTIEKNGLTYALADVRWSGGCENSPSSVYTADVTYTAKATGQAPDEYLVTATYTGQVTKETPGNMLYTLTYEPVPEPVIPDNTDWSAVGRIVLIVIGVLALAVLAVFLFRKFGWPKKKASGYGLPDYEPESRPARRKPHALGYMKRDGGADNA